MKSRSSVQPQHGTRRASQPRWRAGGCRHPEGSPTTHGRDRHSPGVGRKSARGHLRGALLKLVLMSCLQPLEVAGDGARLDARLPRAARTRLAEGEHGAHLQAVCCTRASPNRSHRLQSNSRSYSHANCAEKTLQRYRFLFFQAFHL